MNSYQLFRADGSPTLAWACGECHTLYGKGPRVQTGEAEAEKCCQPYRCRECGVEVERYRFTCSACERQRRAAEHADRLATAVKLDTWDGWVFWSDHGPDEGYFESLTARGEWHAETVADGDSVSPLPEWVFVCKTEPFRGLNVFDLFAQCTEDSFEDAEDQLQGKETLQVAVAAFNAANVGLVSYLPDWGKAVKAC